MNKIIRFVCFALIVFYSAVNTTKVYAQKALDNETIERIISYWSATFEEMRVEQGASKEEFATYNRFYEHQLDSMNTKFDQGIWAGTITLANVKDYMAEKKVIFTNLLSNFRNIEKEFPTSVDEYRYKKRPRLGSDSCFPACYNTGFEDGTFDGWYGYYATNTSTAAAFSTSMPIGGYLGPVVKAAQDPATGNDYQLRITSGVTTDVFLNTYSTYSMPQVSPFGGNYSVMLGDSNRNGQGVAILSQSFLVTSATASITYQYALFLEEPTATPHTYFQQPFFTVSVIDNVTGDTIPGCGTFHQDALVGSSTPGFKGIYYTPETDSVYWKPWTLANVPLKGYVGHCVTIIFAIQDCSLGGHFGYAYVDASCNPEQVISSSPALCGQDSLALTAPPGYTNYTWSGNPTNGIISSDTLQTVYVKDTGTYTVVLLNLTGGVCTDTLTIHIDSAPGPIPTPSFVASTVCAGQPTTFINTSNPITGQFFWDFYNLGSYEDSNITNPTWIYSTPGTYVVKLYELNNGCGAYAYDTITVDPSVAGGFTPAGSGCAPVTYNFTNTSVGATNYSWNYGDPSSNPNDTSTIVINGSHTYTNPGTYTVTMIASNGGPCPDTVREVITVLGPPKPIITGGDSVCTGGVDTLTVTVIGAATYSWAPGGQTSSSIAVTIATPTTYTVTATNVCGSHDTTFTVNIGGLPIALLTTAKDTICSGDTVLLIGGGGGTYKWNNGSTTSNIKVVPLTTTNYTVYVSAPSTTCSDSAVVTIYVNPKITSTLTHSTDSICPGSADTLMVSSTGPTNYIWSNGATTSSIIVNPATTTTYYVLVAGTCANDSIAQVVTVVPFPAVTITASDTVCKGSTATLTAGGGTTYLWSNGSTNNPLNLNITSDTTIQVVGTNGHCSNHAVKTINIYSPLVSTSGPDTICKGVSTTVSVSVSGGNHVYTYSWNNGLTYDSAGPLAVNPPPTQYICTITDGCGTVINDTVNITLRPSPVAAFYPTPDTILGGGFVNFVNLTTNANNYYWTLGDGSYSSDTTPFHEYNVAGTYIVTLVATNSFGCRDTLTKDVYVTESLVIPNVFTPDGSENSTFHVIAGSMQTYDIQIYNRWGQLIFESLSPNIDWTGRSTAGQLESAGTYYYVLTATDYNNHQYKLDGFVQLIR